MHVRATSVLFLPLRYSITFTYTRFKELEERLATAAAASDDLRARLKTVQRGMAAAAEAAAAQIAAAQSAEAMAKKAAQEAAAEADAAMAARDAADARADADAVACAALESQV